MSEQNQSPTERSLQQAADGLLFPSETDSPLAVFFWPAEEADELSPERIAKFVGVPADVPIKSVKLETFFRPATKEESWHNDAEQEQAKRFQALVKTIKDTLDDVKVFRVGATKIDVYIAGRVESGFAGLKTSVVET